MKNENDNSEDSAISEEILTGQDLRLKVTRDILDALEERYGGQKFMSDGVSFPGAFSMYSQIKMRAYPMGGDKEVDSFVVDCWVDENHEITRLKDGYLKVKMSAFYQELAQPIFAAYFPNNRAFASAGTIYNLEDIDYTMSFEEYQTLVDSKKYSFSPHFTLYFSDSVHSEEELQEIYGDIVEGLQKISSIGSVQFWNITEEYLEKIQSTKAKPTSIPGGNILISDEVFKWGGEEEEQEEDNHSHAIILSDEEFEALAEQARQEGALLPTPRHAHRWYYIWMAFQDRCYCGTGKSALIKLLINNIKVAL